MWLLSKCHLQTVQLNKIAVMKKEIITLVCIICGLTASAQDCPICGDWHGVYNGSYRDMTVDRLKDGIIKIHIRVKKNGDSYIVREKTEFPDGRVVYSDFENYTFYNNQKNPSFIGWEETNPDVEYKDKMEDGRYRYRYEYVLRYTIVVEGGKMTYTTWVGVDKYVRSGPYYPDNHYGDFVPYPERERKYEKKYSLYKEDDDW